MAALVSWLPFMLVFAVCLFLLRGFIRWFWSQGNRPDH
jgi:hypothetical protein